MNFVITHLHAQNHKPGSVLPLEINQSIDFNQHI